MVVPGQALPRQEPANLARLAKWEPVNLAQLAKWEPVRPALPDRWGLARQVPPARWEPQERRKARLAWHRINLSPHLGRHRGFQIGRFNCSYGFSQTKSIS